MPQPDLAALVTRIRNALGCSKDMATEYAKAIGENPEVVHGKILVRNDQSASLLTYRRVCWMRRVNAILVVLKILEESIPRRAGFMHG